MENLDKAIEGLKLEDLKTENEVKTFTIEPTKEEIETIIGHLKDGKEYSWIKKNVRRVVEKDGKQISAQGFSFGQIKEIDLARTAKIDELTPKEEAEEIK